MSDFGNMLKETLDNKRHGGLRSADSAAHSTPRAVAKSDMANAGASVGSLPR